MIEGFILALQFLTRIPINISIDFNNDNIKKSTFYYPLVGLILGVLSAIPYYFLAAYNIDIASFLTLLVMIILTGGLHLDGLSDTVDGFFSNKDKEETLEIMKDSRVGAFGVISLILIILFKYILISNIGTSLPISLIFSMANSRLIVVIQIAFKKVAKSNGLGNMVHSSKPRNYILSGIILYIILIILIDIKYVIPLIGGFLISEIISIYTYKKIDGFTGDVYGAIIEITEVISLLIFWGLNIWT